MNNKCLIVLLCFICISCEDILETNISDKQVLLQTPADADSISTGNITFWWNELKGARSYQLLIVSPDKLNPAALLLDSTITNNQFTFQLSEGKYQWCVKGINDGYQTEFTCRSLEVTN
jgi:hypothetical protein